MTWQRRSKKESSTCHAKQFLFPPPPFFFLSISHSLSVSLTLSSSMVPASSSLVPQGAFDEATTYHKQALKEFVRSSDTLAEHLANIRDNLGFAEVRYVLWRVKGGGGCACVYSCFSVSHVFPPPLSLSSLPPPLLLSPSLDSPPHPGHAWRPCCREREFGACKRAVAGGKPAGYGGPLAGAAGRTL